MALQAKYDPKEDRMLLSLEFGEGGPRVFWITRRQWLGLLHEMGAMKLVPPEDKAPPPEPKKAPAKPLPPQPHARAVDAVRVRKQEEGAAKVVFAIGEEGVGLTLPPDGIARLYRVLEQQAERAGWDPRAAMERLNAGIVARNVMRKAKGE